MLRRNADTGIHTGMGRVFPKGIIIFPDIIHFENRMRQQKRYEKKGTGKFVYINGLETRPRSHENRTIAGLFKEFQYIQQEEHTEKNV